MNFNRVISLATVLLLMFSVSSCSEKTDSLVNKEALKSSTTDPSKIVGTFGDETISAAELKFYYYMEKSRMELEAGVSAQSVEEKKKFWETKVGDEDKKQKLMDNAFNNITELKVLLMNAKKDKVNLDQADLENIEYNINQFIQEKGKSDKAQAEKLMNEMYGVSIDEYRNIYGDYILAYNKYASTETAKIKISDSDIKKRFEADKDQFKKVKVKHILIYTTDVNTNELLSEDKVAANKALAKDILKKAQAGEDFEALVEKYSQDSVSKQKKGDYTFAKDETNAELAKWAFSAKSGDIGLIEAPYGIHIVKFVENIEASLGDQEKTTITTYLQNERFDKIVQEMKAKYELVKVLENIEPLGLLE